LTFLVLVFLDFLEYSIILGAGGIDGGLIDAYGEKLAELG